MAISNLKNTSKRNRMKSPIIKKYLTEATSKHYVKIWNAEVISIEISNKKRCPISLLPFSNI